MSGSGTLADPWDFGTALSSARVQSGDTVLLRAGTYAGAWLCQLRGLSGKPVTIKAYPGERVLIDGWLDAYYGYVTLQDLEIFRSEWTVRETEDTSNAPANLPYPTKAGIVTEPKVRGLKVINCIIHDTPLGILHHSSGDGAEFYGCIIYNVGWNIAMRGQGHALYFANEGPGASIVDNCILFNNFGYNGHGYGETNGYLKSMTYRDCIAFNAGVLHGSGGMGELLMGGATVTGPTWLRNCTYGAGTGLDVGYGTAAASNVTLQDNYIADKSAVVVPSKATTFDAVTGNTFIGTLTGFDAASYPQNIYLANRPTKGLQVFVKPNTYATGRGHIAVYNWAGANSVSVDVSAVLDAGDTYKLINVQNYFVDIAMGTVAEDGTISIDMRAVSHTVAAPQGWDAPATTFPTFGAFVLEKT